MVIVQWFLGMQNSWLHNYKLHVLIYLRFVREGMHRAVRATGTAGMLVAPVVLIQHEPTFCVASFSARVWC